MKIHEYQAKAILAKYNVPVPRGRGGVYRTPKLRGGWRKRIGGSVVVKAQIHAGGRGKGGGVKIAKDSTGSPRDRRKDTGHDADNAPDGARRTRREAIAHRRDAAHRARALPGHRARSRGIGKNVFMASAEGGVEIEEVAAKTPERILKEAIEPGLGLLPYQARNLAYGIGITGPAASLAAATR
jgi:succinyl-CoA synthetase beta subunit